MPYTPENNPYIPGDPYSYDLKWIVEQVKNQKDAAESALQAAASAAEAKEAAEIATGSVFYVTPQMFGAKADGVTDDSQAIQDAIDSGDFVIFPEGEYYIDSTILIRKTYWNMDASNAHIIYGGSGYAVDISQSWNLNLRFGVISAANGGCIYLHSSDNTNYVQYINIFFLQLRASSNCVYGYATSSGWVNEIRFYDGRLIAGNNGFYLFKDASIDTMNHWNFYNIGIEGVTTGFYFKNGSSTRISDMVFIGCRYNESFTYLIKSEGLCQYFTFVGGGTVAPSILDVSADSDLWRFIAPTNSKHESLIVQKGDIVTCGYSVVTDGGISIPNNSDLNDYTYPANAYVSTNAGAASLSNCPTSQSFRMRIFSVAGLYYENDLYNNLIQEIIPNSGTEYFRRKVYRNGSLTYNYGSWIKYSKDTPWSSINDTTVGNTKFSYRYNDKFVEWWIETNADTYASQTTLLNIPSGLRPAKTLWQALCFWTNSAVTSQDRNAVRITNGGDVQVIAPNNYMMAHGIYAIA